VRFKPRAWGGAPDEALTRAVRFTFAMEPQFQVTADADEVVMKQHLDGSERPFLFITNFVMPGVGNWVRACA